MKTERIIWGLIFLFIGGILLLDNFGVIDFHWQIVWRFWPLILIVIGANMLFSRGDAARSGIVAVIITLAALAFIAYQGTKYDGFQPERWADIHEEDASNNRQSTDSIFSEPLPAGIHRAELNISGGASSYKLRDTTSELFSASVKSTFGNYSLLRISRDSVAVLNFKMSGNKRWKMNGRNRNEALIKLSPVPVWDLNLEIGAGKIDFDLSAFKLRKLRFEGGAASVEMKLGMPVGLTDVSAESGVSEIKFSIPKAAACQINVDSGLSDTNFDGFVKKDDDTYETENFQTAKNKIVINLEGGLSKFEVNRY